ncbi:uncharacterized protein [Miscanthus floridulus]|uniref:uncharacterized protein n=1 Tax=Miscanthus floridulus TaxID=154761 RepID=UPI00345A0942
MAAQLAATQEQEAEVCRDAEEIHGMFEDLKARSKLEEEEAARILKERDELLEKDAQASRRAIEAQNELETERDLRRKAESRAVALQEKVEADAVLIDRLRGERDEARRSEERLRSEGSTAHEERDRAIRERDEARRVVDSLRVDLETATTRRQAAENVSAGLKREIV